jgi:hypothetical protein
MHSHIRAKNKSDRYMTMFAFTQSSTAVEEKVCFVFLAGGKLQSGNELEMFIAVECTNLTPADMGLQKPEKEDNQECDWDSVFRTCASKLPSTARDLDLSLTLLGERSKRLGLPKPRWVSTFGLGVCLEALATVLHGCELGLRSWKMWKVPCKDLGKGYFKASRRAKWISIDLESSGKTKASAVVPVGSNKKRTEMDLKAMLDDRFRDLARCIGQASSSSTRNAIGDGIQVGPGALQNGEGDVSTASHGKSKGFHLKDHAQSDASTSSIGSEDASDDSDSEGASDDSEDSFENGSQSGSDDALGDSDAEPKATSAKGHTDAGTGGNLPPPLPLPSAPPSDMDGASSWGSRAYYGRQPRGVPHADEVLGVGCPAPMFALKLTSIAKDTPYYVFVSME